MIYEYINGESLLDLIRKKKFLNENESKKIFKQIICGVKYLHENFVVHRDLKIENVLIKNDGTVKIIDFGLSNFYNKNNYLNTFCGSLQFAAPELLKGIVYEGPEIDIWSLGIILFVMVNGKLPFDDKEISMLHEKIKKGEYKWTITPSPSLKRLVNNMIQLDPLKRYSMKRVEQSEWLNGIKCESCQVSENRENSENRE
ncbi:Serine/threonine protein kinase, partial [Pseudoloma neurophilia]